MIKFAANLFAALAIGARWLDGPKRSFSPTNPFSVSRPTDSRHWHDDTDPTQAAAIRAAQLKRDRKADKRAREMRVASWNNAAHQDYREDGGLTRVFPNRLHPFYINRETA